ALRHGVVHYLLVLAETGQLAAADLPKQVRRLRHETDMQEPAAQQAVQTWADIIGKIPPPPAGPSAWRREPQGLHERFFGLGNVLIVGLVGLLASMLPWLAVLEEKRGHHIFIPVEMESMGVHAILNLLAAAGGFFGGALGWMFGTPLSLEFRFSG